MSDGETSMSTVTSEIELPVERDGTAKEKVPAILMRPADPWAILVMAHGAGAGMRHRGVEVPSCADGAGSTARAVDGDDEFLGDHHHRSRHCFAVGHGQRHGVSAVYVP
jgi:hypothetical protein